MQRTKEESDIRAQEDAQLEVDVVAEAERVLSDPYNPYGNDEEAATRWARRTLSEALEEKRQQRASAQPAIPEFRMPDVTPAIEAMAKRYQLASGDEVYAAFMKRYPGNRSRADWARKKIMGADLPVSHGQVCDVL